MEVEQKQINLLDLPFDVLELILSYVTGDKAFIRLTECNKFLKNMIETMPSLKNRIYLDIQANAVTLNEEEKEILEACLNSSMRQYDCLEIFHCSERYVFAEKDAELNLKSLVDKHAGTIKKVDFEHKATSSYYSIMNVMKLLENLNNVEEIALSFEGIVDTNRHRDDGLSFFPDAIDLSFPSNNFNQLKRLTLSINSSIVFGTFKNCSQIEMLEVKMDDSMFMDLSDFNLILKNSSKSLQNLIVDCGKMKDSQIPEFLRELIECELNLKSFEFSTKLLRNNNDVDSLMEFLKSQKSLKELKFISRVDLSYFVNSLRNTINNLELRTIYLFLTRSNSNPLFADNLAWNLDNLESIDFHFYCSRAFGSELTENLFRVRSQTLKNLSVSMMNFQGNNFEKIHQNYQNLVKLDVRSSCINYSSNDIFMILKHLKKLQELEFHFPKDSPFNPQLLDTDEDLKLPEIKTVQLGFNSSVYNEHVVKFLKLVNNTTDYGFRYWDNEDNNTWEIIFRELPKMTQLQCFFIYYDRFDLSLLDQIKAYVLQYNHAPHLLRINRSNIDDWILEQIASKPERDRMAALHDFYLGNHESN